MCDRSPGNPSRLITWALRNRWSLALVAVIILAVATPLSLGLRTSRSIEAMFAADDPFLVSYKHLQQTFGGNAVVMLVYRDPQLMSAEGIQRAALLSQQVEAIEGIRGVLSVAELNDLLGLMGAGGVLGGSQGDLPPLLRNRDVMVRALERLFAGYTHAADGQTSAIVALLEPASAAPQPAITNPRPSNPHLGNPGVDHGAVIRLLQQLASDLPPGASDGVLVGEPVLLEQGFDLIERDGKRLAWWTLGLLSICVGWLLRSLRFVLLQLLVIVWAVTVTRATLALLGMQLSLVSSVLTAIVTVIAVTAVIHLGSRQQLFRRRGYTVWAAGGRTLSWVMPAIFWACITDAAGFLALTASGVVPVQEFGWMMAIASLAVWIAMLLLAPVCLVVTPGGVAGATAADATPVSALPATHRGGWDRWQRWVRRGCLLTAVTLMRYRAAVLVATTVLAAVTWWGVSRLEIESSFLRNFRDDSSIVQAYQQVEAELEGAGVWDVVLPAPYELSDRYMDSVRTLERQLREIDVDGQRLTKVLSIADADRVAAVNPLLRVASPSLRLAGMRSAVPAFADALLVPQTPAPSARYLRVMLRSKEHLETPIKMRLIDEVQRVVAEHTQSPQWAELFSTAAATSDDALAGHVTGYYVLLARLVSRLIADQWVCLMWAAVLIAGLLWMATRSLVWACAALIPNLLPVLLVLAVMGGGGHKMNMGAAMIAAVSIGLSIDGSVHFLSGFRRQWLRHRNANRAVLFAQRQIGLPLIMATLSLVIGFAALATSEFVPTATFGQLTAAALVIGTLANLLLMPVLMQRGRGW